MNGSVLASLSQEELAGHLWQRRTISGGVGFVRNEVRPSKAVARAEVLTAFGPGFFGGTLSILTMPSLRWTFERELLNRREAARLRRGKAPKRTQICAIESDEAIYRASFKFMPGTRDNTFGMARGIAILPTISCATSTVQTPLIKRYHRCSFEDYAFAPERHHFCGAWLDFNGPLSVRRIAAIAELWKGIRKLLVVTGMNARTDAETSSLVGLAGGAAPLLRKSLEGSRLVRSISYFDTTPMFQATLVRSVV